MSVVFGCFVCGVVVVKVMVFYGYLGIESNMMK